MKAVLYLTHRVMYQWPQVYIDDFAHKANHAGYDLHIISDDTDPDLAKREIGKADFFLGVPGPFDHIEPKGKRVYFSGAKNLGGVVANTQCAGCIDNMLPQRVKDCLWLDGLCMWEITPNDVLEAMCCES